MGEGEGGEIMFDTRKERDIRRREVRVFVRRGCGEEQ